eukprot:4087446-Prymnesium_polylepis.1
MSGPKPAYKRRFARQRWAMLRQRLPEIIEMARSDRKQASWRKALAGWHERSAEQALRGLPVLHGQDDATIAALLQYTSVMTIQRYAELFLKGRPMAVCYVILQGCVRVTLRNLVQPRRMLPGAMLAGGAWLDDTKHINTATAEQPSVLLAIRAAEAKEDPRLTEVADAFRRVEGEAWKISLLRDFVPLFSDLPIARLRALAPIFNAMSVPRGQTIIAEGDQGNRVFVLVTGEVLAYRKGPNGEDMRLRTITDQSDFTYFGEVALFQKVLRTANVRSMDESVILYVDECDFATFRATVPNFEERVKALKAYDEAKQVAATRFVAHKSAANEAEKETAGRDNLRKAIRLVGTVASLGRDGDSLTSWVESLEPEAPVTVMPGRAQQQLTPALRRR